MSYFEHEPFKEKDIYIYIYISNVACAWWIMHACSSWVESSNLQLLLKKLAYSQIIIKKIKIKVHTKYMHGVGD